MNLKFCHLEFGYVGFSHDSISSQSHSHLPRLVATIWTKKFHSFILTQLEDGSNLEFCHLGFCHLGFSHLSIPSQTHSYLPRLVPTICTKKHFTHSFWLNLMMAAILNSAMLDSDTVILDSDILLSFLRFTQKHSHSTLTLTQTNSILSQTHLFSPNLLMAGILNSAILNLAILDSAILVFPLKHTHTCLRLVPTLCTKNFTHSFWLNLMMAAILNSDILDTDTVILDSDTLLTSLRFTQKHSHSILTLTQTNSILTQTHSFSPNLMMAAILNSTLLNLAILDSAILVFPFKLTHTCQDWFPPFVQKNFTHSFWLNLMMAAILNSVMLDSDTAILDSDTLLSSLRFTQKHSHSILTLTQTNSIGLKLIHSHLTWCWQPSWIPPSWIWPSWIQLS